MSLCLKKLKKEFHNIRMVVSFSDTEQGHHGGVYQANNWLYSGQIESTANKFFIIHGKKYHGKSLYGKYGVGGQKLQWLRDNVDKNAEYAPYFPKHRYLMPLDKDMRDKIQPLSKPYPKRVKQATTSDQLERRQCDTDPHAPSKEVFTSNKREPA